ncbi:MAG TPA: hypothetical protein VEI83_12240 [Acidimicrobiales bacterium]|nr:hypothetical protein [Acidimicrobiales bacterium]
MTDLAPPPPSAIPVPPPPPASPPIAAWRLQLDSTLSGGLACEAEIREAEAATRARDMEVFQAHCAALVTVARPVLEDSVRIVRERGIGAALVQLLRDQPSAMPRAFELRFSIDRFATRGRSRLVLRCLEGGSLVQASLVAEAPGMGGTATERIVGISVEQLTEELIGDLVVAVLDMIWEREPHLPASADDAA